MDFIYVSMFVMDGLCNTNFHITQTFTESNGCLSLFPSIYVILSIFLDKDFSVTFRIIAYYIYNCKHVKEMCVGLYT